MRKVSKNNPKRVRYIIKGVSFPQDVHDEAHERCVKAGGIPFSVYVSQAVRDRVEREKVEESRERAALSLRRARR